MDGKEGERKDSRDILHVRPEMGRRGRARGSVYICVCVRACVCVCVDERLHERASEQIIDH